MMKAHRVRLVDGRTKGDTLLLFLDAHGHEMPITVTLTTGAIESLAIGIGTRSEQLASQGHYKKPCKPSAT